MTFRRARHHKRAIRCEDGDRVDRHALVDAGLRESDLTERIQRIRLHADPDAALVGYRGLALQQRDLDVLQRQSAGGDKPDDPAAHDQC